jgi:hypothetical protein
MKKHLSGAAMLLVLFIGVVYAAEQENYAPIRQTSNKGAPDYLSALSGLDGSDSTTWNRTTAATGRAYPTNNDPFVEINPRLSAAGATCCIAVGRRDSAGKFVGIADIQTATALDGGVAVYDGTGYFPASPLYFATNGWTTYEIKVLDVSGSNTVSLLPTMVGATGSAAE